MFILLSHKINLDTPMYGGKKGIKSTSLSLIEKGNPANTSKWEFPNHLGTHVDFPYHFYQNGQTIDDFTADFWIFDGKKVQIVEVNLFENDLLIKPEHIRTHNIDLDAEFLILKTGFGNYRNQKKYWESNPGLSTEVSDWIIKNLKKIRVVGLDSISVSSWQHRDIGKMVHKKMLDPEKPILIIEDMNLSGVRCNTIFKTVYIAPLMISKSDGAPCTIIAEVENNG